MRWTIFVFPFTAGDCVGLKFEIVTVNVLFSSCANVFVLVKKKKKKKFSLKNGALYLFFTFYSQVIVCVVH